MHATLYSGALMGVDAQRIEVEADVSSGMQIFHMTGLPEGAVRESRLRTPAAIANSGVRMPRDKITVNLAPADLRKDGSLFDLPIALGILLASDIVRPSAHWDPERWLIVGELSLKGELRPGKGILPMAILARDLGLQGIMLPRQNAAEAAVVKGIEVQGLSSLEEAMAWIEGRQALERTLAEPVPERAQVEGVRLDFSDVSGQQGAKRALEVAAAGGHNVLMVGPPGSGKSMLAKRVPSILPPMQFEEALETTKIYSILGALGSPGLMRERPFRHPHHTISDVGIVGGGSGMPLPGEISLAHNGVLFLDELPEFRKHVLEVMRQPLEDGSVTISRSLMTLTYPASVMWIAAMNPCKCGYFGSSRCACPIEHVRQYRSKISGPLMDRIDIHVEVPQVTYAQLRKPGESEPSADIRARVARARDIQAARLAPTLGGRLTNASMSTAQVRAWCGLAEAGHRMMSGAVDRLGMSARAHDRVLKVARTIADLAGAAEIDPGHLAEAIQYRALDRKLQGSQGG